MSNEKIVIENVVKKVVSNVPSDYSPIRKDVCDKALRILDKKGINCACDPVAHNYLCEALDKYCY